MRSLSVAERAGIRYQIGTKLGMIEPLMPSAVIGQNQVTIQRARPYRDNGTALAREHSSVSDTESLGTSTAIKTHYLWGIAAVVGINGFMALLISKVLFHATGVCTGLASACNTIFLEEASSRRLHIIVESLLWAAIDVGIVVAWVSNRRESLRLKRLAKIEAGIRA